MISKFKENAIAFGVAVLLAGGVMLTINSSGNLATDILGTKKTNSVMKTDVSFLYKSGSIEMISNKNIDNVSTVIIEFVFDKNKVQINKDNINTVYDFTSSTVEGGNGTHINIINVGKINKKGKILVISNITKEQFDNINIGNISILSNNGDNVDLTSSK